MLLDLTEAGQRKKIMRNPYCLRFIDNSVDPRCFNDLWELQILESLSRINSKIFKICLSLVLMTLWTWNDEVSLFTVKMWNSWWDQWESQEGVGYLLGSVLQLRTQVNHCLSIGRTHAQQKYKSGHGWDTYIPSFHWFYLKVWTCCEFDIQSSSWICDIPAFLSLYIISGALNLQTQ